MMSTPFAFDTVESSMRVVVDGVDIRVAFSKDLHTKETLSLWSGRGMVALVLWVQTPIYSPGPSTLNPFMR